MAEDQDRGDIFTKMTERREIISFVNNVRKHPCLYDTTSPQYSNPAYTRKAWAEIANKCNSTITKCKDKWRGIRTAFLRSTRNGKFNETRKPYYLKDHLQFIIPFTKFAADAEVAKRLYQDAEDDAEIVFKEDTSDDDNNLDNDADYADENNETNENLGEFDVINSFNDLETNRHEIYVTNNDNINCRLSNKSNDCKKRKTNTEHLENHPRKMFLLSLLPDLESFDEQEMRVFRREVIKSIDNIMSSRENRHD